MLLDRYGLVTRGSVGAERGGVGALGNFSAAYRVLSALEEVGASGAATSSTASAPPSSPRTAWWTGCARSRVASAGRRTSRRPSCSPPPIPANAYGASVDWPHRQQPADGVADPAAESAKMGHRPGRKAGALVVLHEGLLAWYVERGGRTVLTFHQDAEMLEDNGSCARRIGALGARRCADDRGGGRRTSAVRGPAWASAAARMPHLARLHSARSSPARLTYPARRAPSARPAAAWIRRRPDWLVRPSS